MKKNMSFVLLKQRIANAAKLTKTKVAAKLAIAAHRIEVKRLLANCPDERSRTLLKARIEKQERDLEIRYARIHNYQQQMEIGFFDMIEAILVAYGDDPEIELDRAKLAEINELFNNGKSKLLMYSRWMVQLNPGSCAQYWVDLIEPLTLSSYKTVDEWRNFVGKLPLC